MSSEARKNVATIMWLIGTGRSTSPPPAR